MTELQVLDELRVLGSTQTAKTYRRHGASQNVFGVSAADMKKLTKRIKVNHALAKELWASGNHDARILATMIAAPNQADSDLLETWVHDLQDYIVSDAPAGFVART